MEVEYRKHRPVWPVYAVALFWLIFTLVHPLYRASDYVTAILLSAVVLIVAKAIWPTVEVPVTEEQYRHLKEELDVFIKNREDYRYNYTGLVGVMFGKNVEDGKHFFCSQFVSYVFNKSGILLHSKKSGLTRPYDFHIQLKDRQIYKGKLSEYRKN